MRRRFREAWGWLEERGLHFEVLTMEKGFDILDLGMIGQVADVETAVLCYCAQSLGVVFAS